MADIFTPQEMLRLFRNKKILIFGGSNIRGLYKDLVWLTESCSYIPQRHLKGKLEKSYHGDRLVEGEKASRGRDYREVRHFHTPDRLVELHFVFCTRIYSPYMAEVLDRYRCEPPDLIVVNSCVWDISRWGPRGVDDFKVNLRKFLEHVQSTMRADTMLMWTTTMPVSSEPRGGFLIKQVEFLRHTLRFDVMEANSFSASLVRQFGYDVLDIHYHFRCLIHHRSRDGIHWQPQAVRGITNMLLTHVALAWNRILPGRGPRRALERLSEEAHLTDEEVRELVDFTITEREATAARMLRGDQAPGRR
ncbi:PC-esterase domain-containing protein 1A [Amphibalanus amphitrite]|uniref:PC-esterase domain-containing protein 1A n=1 Tax=Amphibalanus amphitrite TaxID=1232801 RepID=A0A6A4WT30_AMPAM|nr:PC-esterase domain-containing protein 1A-like isoform X3 [Amphibalanus amphitrite]XP_043243471.1 PC-esterase domain-containing protein 1A-like isoform X3 [Amphibalanus amphitrite]XP_043243472.1 PC-esterase domain-containing protein 1A-like isoform X3 [Amphibalanus amphitrite]XP_043243473.1 PC-esterase domain-containing protein 1A-like isoform X3 [Amphibalanus amphitrite]XP_043243474.1 PC-esterase domain-containing protein 1A-like isoform X3 [Amphibalanus amphitrite]XP_043243475.1 PC-esteras